tara:strand:+ start:9786 stop:10256 length:471 start_codon:yes stop_codon:yes gene_type:complete
MEKKKYFDLPTTPLLTSTKEYLDVAKEMAESPMGKSFSIDTFRADLLKEKNLKILCSKYSIYLFEELNFRSYSQKVISYGIGIGSVTYYKYNKYSWSYYRRLLSLTHVFRNYIIIFPLKCILKPKYFMAIPFFWSTAIMRYYGFFKNIFFRNNLIR